jgi:phosphoglycerate dehydrogenase-like enzyme
MKKIKIHIRNNHWKEGFLPCDLEGEKHSTITEEEFEKGLSQYSEIKDKIEYLVDWDEDNYISSMKEADVLLGWQFQQKILEKLLQTLNGSMLVQQVLIILSPFDWMKNDLILTNSSGVHSKKAGEFGLMSILMLQNQITKIVTNQKNKEFVTLLSKPIDGFKVVGSWNRFSRVAL